MGMELAPETSENLHILTRLSARENLMVWRLFVVFIGGWLGYEIARFVIGDGLFSIYFYGASSFSGSIWFMLFFFYLWCFFWPSGGWLYGDKGFWFWLDRVFWWPRYILILFNLARANQWFQYNNLKVFLGFFVTWIVILLFVLIHYLNSL